jgi:hypothetical protein
VGSEPWDECVRIGQLLADEALRIVAKAPLQAEPELRCHWRAVEFPVDSPQLRAILKTSPLGLARGDERSLRVRINQTTTRGACPSTRVKGAAGWIVCKGTPRMSSAVADWDPTGADLTGAPTKKSRPTSLEAGRLCVVGRGVAQWV